MKSYGGSKQSGYIQMLLAKHPELFELLRVSNPSVNLRDWYEKREKKSRVNKERNLFFELLLKMLNSKSTRDFRKFRDEYPEFTEKFGDIIGAQKGLDFYPTPVQCLSGLENIIKYEHTTSILEPTAGLGNLLNWIEENKNSKAKVTAIEFNHRFIDPLKELFPKVNILEGDFLEYTPTNNDFDCIVCNPPFNLGKDKNVYIDFLFKCLYLLNTSSKAGTVSCIFICPTLTTQKYKDGDQFDFREILEIGFPVVSRAFKNVLGETMTRKEFKEYIDGESNELVDTIEPIECVVAKNKCEGFGGTGVQASIYVFKIINYRRGGRRFRQTTL